MSKTDHNPSRYHELSMPFASEASANKAIADFYEAVKAARIAHGIPDVLVVLSVNIADVGCAMTTLNMGSSEMQEGLAAYAYGQERAVRGAQISALLAGKVNR
jgi:hypothetical protein